MGNNDNGHSREQGWRVHHLANLGGLIALAGLDLEPPDFLLGALLSLADEAATLSREEREKVATMGRNNLGERAAGKRSWKSRNRANELQAITLSNDQLREIIQALGGEAPEDPTQLPLAFSCILTRRSAMGWLRFFGREEVDIPLRTDRGRSPRRLVPRSGRALRRVGMRWGMHRLRRGSLSIRPSRPEVYGSF